MEIRKNSLLKLLVLSAVLCCFGHLVNTYADVQQSNSLVCFNSTDGENCIGSHDDSLDDDQLESTTHLAAMAISYSEYDVVHQLSLCCNYACNNWQPPKYKHLRLTRYC